MRLPSLTSDELRSPLKIVNHRLTLKEKIEVANKLGFLAKNHSSSGKGTSWQSLEALFSGETSLNECLTQLSFITGYSMKELRMLILNIGFTPNMEIHPTDRCNLKCHYCSFERTVYEMSPSLADTAIRLFEPCAITFAGGGETSVSKHFPEIVENISIHYPEIKMGWITNGILHARADVVSKMSWIRISVDSASERTHKLLKGTEGFEKCFENFTYILEKTDVPNIGLGFLFQNENISEVSIFLEHVWSLIKDRDVSTRKRVNVQFRPLRPSQDIFLSVLAGQVEWQFSIDDEAIADQIKMIESRRNEDLELDLFLKRQTNIDILNTFERKKWWMPNQSFSMCSVSLLYTLVRADGSLYSCIHKSESPKDCLGRISENSSGQDLDDLLLKINLSRFWMMGLNRNGCNSFECRYSHLNRIAEENLHSNFPNDNSDNIKLNPFW
jgi:sulfatase maturation enzyme AslB (radical SAM superfamily)